ncbi:MAG: ABC transporter permease [Bifidobacteriaceae bacterium]|jgi:ABC-type dipeptide/oligopeptide/nickel transport system permease component|nr:ABC transporter permease [Bifidobacteriaceae bacterium]
MAGMIARRLALGIFVLWGAVTLMFFLIRVAPGDPAATMLGPDATLEEIEALRGRLGLDRPVALQYLSYLGQLLTLDFGVSARSNLSALDLVLSRLPATMQLTLSSATIAVIVGLSLSLAGSRRPDGVLDRVFSVISICFQGMPTFWVGIMLILLFSLRLRILPSYGAGSLRNLVLPAVTLALPFVAIIARISRATFTEAMREPYIQTALSKGLTSGQALRGHAFRNAVGPVVTIIGLQIGTMIGGAVVVENVFAWPGLGTLIVGSVANRDYAVVQAAVLIIALFVLALTLITDIANAWLDPRIRTGGVS